MRKVLIVLGGISLTLAAATPVVAQQGTTTTTPGYPGPTNTAAAPTNVTQDVGDHPEGTRFILQSCNFSGTQATNTFNGTGLGAKAILANSCENKDVTIVEDGVPDGNDALGTFRPLLAAVGLRTPLIRQQVTLQPAVVIDGRRLNANRPGVNNVIVASGTGRNGAPRTVTSIFRIALPGQAAGRTQGTLAKTGATILRWTLPGVAFIGVGALLVMATRRRRLPE